MLPFGIKRSLYILMCGNRQLPSPHPFLPCLWPMSSLVLQPDLDYCTRSLRYRTFVYITRRIIVTAGIHHRLDSTGIVVRLVAVEIECQNRRVSSRSSRARLDSNVSSGQTYGGRRNSPQELDRIATATLDHMSALTPQFTGKDPQTHSEKTNAAHDGRVVGRGQRGIGRSDEALGRPGGTTTLDENSLRGGHVEEGRKGLIDKLGSGLVVVGRSRVKLSDAV